MNRPADIKLAAVVGIFFVRHFDIDIAKGLIPASAVFVADPKRIFVKLDAVFLRLTENSAA
jgi:hypothetical protein